MLGVLAQGVAQIGGANWEAPSFIEMVYPGVEDRRTAAEITRDVLAGLG